GRFYPGTRAELARTVEDLLAAARPGAHPAGARGAVAPHAGYVYSGMTAAHVFARLRLPPVVVVLAPNHTGVCHAPGGASLWEAGAFATPVGDVPVDDAFATALVDASPLVASDHDAHRAEHAVEVQLPFLLALRPDVRIVPLILAWDGWDDCRALGEALAALARRWTEPVLLLASSDLNHYEPAAVNELKDLCALAAVGARDGGGAGVGGGGCARSPGGRGGGGGRARRRGGGEQRRRRVGAGPRAPRGGDRRLGGRARPQDRRRDRQPHAGPGGRGARAGTRGAVARRGRRGGRPARHRRDRPRPRR